MRYLSVCSGIEAATVAWHPLGWTPAGFAEIEPFPRAVLEQRHGAVARATSDMLPMAAIPPNPIIGVNGLTVRKLTPRECERLQGFPDDFTAIRWPKNNKTGKSAPDGPRYKALGNSMAVNVMRWIGARIALVERAVEEAARQVNT